MIKTLNYIQIYHPDPAASQAVISSEMGQVKNFIQSAQVLNMQTVDTPMLLEAGIDHVQTERHEHCLNWNRGARIFMREFLRLAARVQYDIGPQIKRSFYGIEFIQMLLW